MLSFSDKNLILIILSMIILIDQTFTGGLNDANKCVDDTYGCPLDYGAICAYNTTCYRSYRSKCEFEEVNSNLPEEEEQFIIINEESNCKSSPSYTPVCEQCLEVCLTTSNPVCAYSCRDECYKTFLNNCSLGVFNCERPEDYYPYMFYGNCGSLESCPGPV